MNLPPEVKKQLEEQKKQCIFCKLIAKEQDAKIVFEDKQTIAMLDIFPAVKGHTLFMHKEHYPIMAYLQPEEFRHLFGLVPALTNAITEGIVTTASTIFIANGGAAGQQAPHFMMHILPRDPADGFFNFVFKDGKKLPEEKARMLAQNLGLMMQNHFTRNQASWHSGNGAVPGFLQDIYDTSPALYEDEQVLAVLPRKSAAPGHIEIYSKQQQTGLTLLSAEESSHLFSVASLSAAALFEGLQAQGTNIIVKSGMTDDNERGMLCAHVLPRYQDDALQGLLWQPTQPGYDLDGIKKKIQEKTWNMEYKEEKKDVRLPTQPKPINLGRVDTPKPKDEIKDAVEKIRSSKRA